METGERNLFGDPSVGMRKPERKGRGVREILEDYEGFVEKFKPKLTTDDCYTPPEIYDAVREWVDANVIRLDGLRIVRPFRPGGDFEAEDYGPDDIVLDNPPFSILARIRRYYAARGIRYFLFAPALTQFSSDVSDDECFIVARARIRYENGAVVNTSFITNCVGDGTRIWVAGDLSLLLSGISDRLAKAGTKELPVYDYPPEVFSSARDGKVAERGITYRVMRDECVRITQLDAQRDSGTGYLLSPSATLRAEQARRAAEEARRAKGPDAVWQLSDRERKLIENLENSKNFRQ